VRARRARACPLASLTLVAAAVGIDVGRGRYPVCPANTFSLPGSTECTACPEGSSSTAGSDTCQCEPGFAVSGSGATLTCTPCAAGTYSPSGTACIRTCLASIGTRMPHPRPPRAHWPA